MNIFRACINNGLFKKESPSKKDGKREFLEYLIGEGYDLVKNFDKVQEMMHYKRPVYLINLLKKNKDLISESELEGLIIKYTGENSGSQNNTKLEKFKALLKKHDLLTESSTIMNEMGYSKIGNFMNFIYTALKYNEEVCSILGLDINEYDAVHTYYRRIYILNFSYEFKTKARLERENKISDYLEKTKFEKLDFFKLLPIAGFKMPVYLSRYLDGAVTHVPEIRKKIYELLLQYEKYELRKNIGHGLYSFEEYKKRFNELFPGEPIPGPLLPKANRLKSLISSRKRTDLTPEDYVEKYKQRLRWKLDIKTWKQFNILLEDYSKIIFQ